MLKPKNSFLFSFILMLALGACAKRQNSNAAKKSASTSKNTNSSGLYVGAKSAQNKYKVNTKQYLKSHYTKHHYYIKMRDGVKLYTVVYSPKDTTQKYPFLMKRTPYSCRPYKEGAFPRVLSHNPYLVKDGYIFVCQDVRGRWMSHGDYTNMTPNQKDTSNVDESTDAYDSIKWLVHNIPDNNGKVGQYGISYPGFYTSASLPDENPHLAASSPQAPIADFYFDDFHRYGAFTLSYLAATPWFGFQSKPTTKRWYNVPKVFREYKDGYWFYLHKTEPLKKMYKYFGHDDFFWNNIVNHPNYDEFWQKRDILPALRGIHSAVLIVGGWFDAQDLYGALHTYQTIEHHDPKAKNILVMGPWRHGGWAGFHKNTVVGGIYYGTDINRFFKKNIEAPLFRYYLKGDSTLNLPEAYMFDTGAKKWSKFGHWPPKNVRQTKYYLQADDGLSTNKPKSGSKEYSQYISNIHKPVPCSQDISFGFVTPHQSADQRFAVRRNDVLTFTTKPLGRDVTIAGSMNANLWVSTSSTDSDYIVKVIDVFPPSGAKRGKHTPKTTVLDNFHELVRIGIMRGRYRNSFSHPEAFTPGKVTKVKVPLNDIYHTFKKGHKIQVMIQSTCFPWYDLNPQTFVKNIYKADSSDFKNARERIYHTPNYPTSVEVKVLPEKS
jgi:putative CocE/NonD family hydrolase